jgi:hypothetical protein
MVGRPEEPSMLLSEDLPSWKHLPHGHIARLAENLWTVEGSLPSLPIRRVMTLARRRDGALVMHSAIALDEATMRRLEALGDPMFVIVPNGYHRLDPPAFARRYPRAQVLCPRGARKRVAEVVRVDGGYQDFPPDSDVRLLPLEGTKEGEGVMEVTSDDGVTLTFNDVIFNMPHAPGAKGMLFRVGGWSGGPRVTPIARLALINDKKAFRAHLLRLADTPNLVRIVVSHHLTITDRPAEVLRTVAASL